MDTALRQKQPMHAAPGQKKDPVKEFKTLVKALHKEGLELVVELYFDGTQSPSYVVDVLRFWLPSIM